MRQTFITHLKNGEITNKATTQRTNYPFNSYCEFDGTFIAASGDGLYTLGGETDNGVEIDAYFSPIKTDFGTFQPKRMRVANISYFSTGNMRINLTNDDDSEIEYLVESVNTSTQTRKVKLAERPKGTFWKYEIGNVAGAYFLLHRIDLDIIFIDNWSAKN